MNTIKKTIFLVDDDALFLKSLENEFKQLGTYDVVSFLTGEQCLEKLSLKPDIIVLDYYLNSIDKKALNGILILDKIKAYNTTIPVIILSVQDKIEVAVNCMHHHASDYVVKNETAFIRLSKIIKDILRTQKIEKELNWYMDRM